MRRRTLLGCFGGGVSFLAGCSDRTPESVSRADTADGGPPQSETAPDGPDAASADARTRLLAPQRTRVGVPFTVRVVVSNDGDESRTVSRSVVDLTGGESVGGFSRHLTPGERFLWESPQLTPEAVPASGTIDVAVEGTDASADVRVFEPLHTPATHTYDDGLTIRVEGIRLYRGYPHEIDGERRWNTAEDGSRFAFVFLSVTDVADDGVVRSPPARRGLLLQASGPVYRPASMRYTPLTGVVSPGRFVDDRHGKTATRDVPEYDPIDIRRVADGSEHPTEPVYGAPVAAPDRTVWLAYTVPAGVPASAFRLLASR